MELEVIIIAIVILIVGGAMALASWTVNVLLPACLVIICIIIIVLLTIKWRKPMLIILAVSAVCIAVGIPAYHAYLDTTQNNAEVRIYTVTEDCTVTYYNKYRVNNTGTITFSEGDTVCLYRYYSSYSKKWGTELCWDTSSIFFKDSIYTYNQLLNDLSLSDDYISLTYQEFEEGYDRSLRTWMDENQ